MEPAVELLECLLFSTTADSFVLALVECFDCRLVADGTLFVAAVKTEEEGMDWWTHFLLRPI